MDEAVVARLRNRRRGRPTSRAGSPDPSEADASELGFDLMSDASEVKAELIYRRRRDDDSPPGSGGAVGGRCSRTSTALRPSSFNFAEDY